MPNPGPWTRHGHDIPGVTVAGPGRPPRYHCGGVTLCPLCWKDALRHGYTPTPLGELPEGSDHIHWDIPTHPRATAPPPRSRHLPPAWHPPLALHPSPYAQGGAPPYPPRPRPTVLCQPCAAYRHADCTGHCRCTSIICAPRRHA